MSNQWIVISINIIYSILLIFIFIDKKDSKPKDIKEDDYFEGFIQYQTTGLVIVLFMVLLSMLRNSHMFNYDLMKVYMSPNRRWVIAYFIQFVLQFLIILLYFVPTGKGVRLIHQSSIMFMMLPLFYTFMFSFRPIAENKIELTLKEVRIISKELSKFQEDISNKIIGLNKSMESILVDLSKKESDLNELNNILKQKESELEEINSVITVDKDKVKDLLNYIEKEETLTDKIWNFIGVFLMGVVSSYFTLYLPMIRRSKNKDVKTG